MTTAYLHSWINGEVADSLPLGDRGLHYGDGIFRTLAVHQGQVIWLDAHLDKLLTDATALGLPVPDRQIIETELRMAATTAPDAVIKLMLTRISDKRGYGYGSNSGCRRIMLVSGKPQWPDTFWTQGIAVRWCKTQLVLQPKLAGIKHLNRLEQVMARAEWQDDNIQEGLLCDAQGQVIEGTASNLFVIKNDVLYTPDLASSGVAGVSRQTILQHAGTIMRCEIKPLDRTECVQADELFLSNALIGIWPVRSLDKQAFEAGHYSNRLKQLIKHPWITQS